MSVLIVVAHPDDEILGCGGSAGAFAKAGKSITACILSSEVAARQHRPEPANLLADITRSHTLLGLESAILGDFPNLELNMVPHRTMVKFIEEAIERTQANFIFTHHPYDLNEDHRLVSRACQAASRLSLRNPGRVPPLECLLFMEILSSTDWRFRGSGECFEADTFFELGEELLVGKIAALNAYAGVMREFPHPRSVDVIRGLAAYRGGQSGLKFAEAFQTAHRLLRLPNAS